MSSNDNDPDITTFIRIYQDLLNSFKDVNSVVLPLPLARSKMKPKANSEEAFRMFAQAAGAAEALTSIGLFAFSSGLLDSDDFSISCLPAITSSNEIIRASTVSVGWVEVLVVYFERSTGYFAGLDILVKNDVDMSWQTEWPEVDVIHTDLKQKPYVLSLPGDIALDFLLWAVHESLIRDWVQDVRVRTGAVRKDSWHNSWMEEIAFNKIARAKFCEELDSLELEPALVLDVSKEDREALVRVRRSQKRFRELLFRHQPSCCAICGVDLQEVLEACHLIPHAKGGRASIENGRILCANHHRAFDSGLYEWPGDQFRWIGGGGEPILGRS